MKYLPFTIFSLLLVCSCNRQLPSAFDNNQIPSAPDYSNEKYWAALPTTEDAADVVLADGLQDWQAEAKADVFFLYPTIYGVQTKGDNWNADVNDAELNEKIDNSTIKYQASIFNGVGKIYAPRYRQMHISVYSEMNGERRASAQQAQDLAYQDLATAFEYYLENYNNGRPIVIAAHSQGTTHGKRLLKEYFDGTELQDQLVAAYLVGIPVSKNLYNDIPACSTPTQTGCVISWRAFQKDYTPKSPTSDTIIVTNPLTWSSDKLYGAADLNEGLIVDDKSGFFTGRADAEVKPDLGILWVERPKRPLRLRIYPSKNFHIADYNLFYANVRENAQQRVEAFLD